MNDIRKLSGLGEKKDPYAELDRKANRAFKGVAGTSKFSPQVEKMLDTKYLKFHNGDPDKRTAVGQKLQDRFDKVMAARQAAAVKSAKP